MRRFIILVFTLFYSVISSGAVGLLHFCQHESSLHLGVAHEEHHNETLASYCCHAVPEKVCHEVPATGIQDDDCCTVSTTNLDQSLVNGENELIVLFNEEKSTLILPVNTHTKRVKANGAIQNTGPPLYVRLHKLILYA